MKQRHVWQSWWMAGLLALTVVSGCASGTAGGTATPAAVPPDAPAVETAVATPDLLTVDAEGNTSVEPAALEAALASMPVSELTEAEIAGLVWMREEEKLARDVYLTLYELWGQPVLQNIANSEATHTEAVLTLLERYSIPDPADGNAVGVFTNTELQALYDALVKQGAESLVAALKVGAAVEEIDILDLEERSAETEKTDILTVYANLTRGSRNHLRSFVRTLERTSGEVYIPQYMSQEAYDAIVTGEIERGGQSSISGRRQGGRGNGRG